MDSPEPPAECGRDRVPVWSGSCDSPYSLPYSRPLLDFRGCGNKAGTGISMEFGYTVDKFNGRKTVTELYADGTERQRVFDVKKYDLSLFFGNRRLKLSLIDRESPVNPRPEPD